MEHIQINRLILGVLCVSVFSLLGCNPQVSDFVKVSRPGNTIENPKPSPVAENSKAYKVSPGQMRASSSQLAVVGNVTATTAFLSSSQVSARVGISRSRATQQ